MDAHCSHPSGVEAFNEWADGPAAVTLRVTDGDARRIVRALEETSVRLGGSPSGSRLASSYIRLAGLVRTQATAEARIELPG